MDIRQALLDAWKAWDEVVDDTTWDLRRQVFLGLLTGYAVPLDVLATVEGSTPDEIRRQIRRLAERGECTLEDDTVTGILGLSVTPTPHRLTLPPHLFYTWCALDAVAIPAALDRPRAWIDSQYRDTAEPLHWAWDGQSWHDGSDGSGVGWISLVAPDVYTRQCDGT